MDSREFEKEKALSYNDLVKYLLDKYGHAQYDYFCNESCKSKNRKVPRTSEGLYCHHIYEKYVSNLCDPFWAKQSPYEYQKANNLVYCNLLEHFLLHIKIAYDYADFEIDKNNPLQSKHKRGSFPRKISWDTSNAYNIRNMIPITGGIDFISSDINTLFSQEDSLSEWSRKCYMEIKDNFDDYISLIIEMIQKAVDSFTGKKNYKFKEPIVGVTEICSKSHGKGVLTQIIEDEILHLKEFQTYHFEFEDNTSMNIRRRIIDKGDYANCIKEIVEIFSKDSLGNKVDPVYYAILEKLHSLKID